MTGPSRRQLSRQIAGDVKNWAKWVKEAGVRVD
jgi:hypothetical protein